MDPAGSADVCPPMTAPSGALFSFSHELNDYDDVAFGAGSYKSPDKFCGDKVRTRKSPAIVGPCEHHDRPARFGGKYPQCLLKVC